MTLAVSHPMIRRLLQFDSRTGALPDPANDNIQRTYDALVRRELVDLDTGVYYITPAGVAALHGIVPRPDSYLEERRKSA